MDQFTKRPETPARHIDPEIAKKLVALGRGIEPAALNGTRALFLPQLKDAQWPEIKVHRD